MSIPICDKLKRKIMIEIKNPEIFIYFLYLHVNYLRVFVLILFLQFSFFLFDAEMQSCVGGEGTCLWVGFLCFDFFFLFNLVTKPLSC